MVSVKDTETLDKILLKFCKNLEEQSRNKEIIPEQKNVSKLTNFEPAHVKHSVSAGCDCGS